jgi:hypothetical protein
MSTHRQHWTGGGLNDTVRVRSKQHQVCGAASCTPITIRVAALLGRKPEYLAGGPALRDDGSTSQKSRTESGISSRSLWRMPSVRPPEFRDVEKGGRLA